MATANNISNDATGDQTDAINTLLSDNVGTPIFFPAGIYLVKSTVFVPVGSIILGEGWSQIMGTGEYFEDELNPQVMVQVGYEGDSGTLEISDMLFTVKGPTAGAILMEWNVRESTQGSGKLTCSSINTHGLKDSCSWHVGFSLPGGWCQWNGPPDDRLPQVRLGQQGLHGCQHAAAPDFYVLGIL